MPIADLAGAKIGIEATTYLQQLMEQPPTQEPLRAALGGEPIGLRHHIVQDLERWKTHHMTPLFVFEGQSTVGRDETALREAQASLTKMQRAWKLYGENHADEAVKTFGAAGGLRASSFYGVLQSILDERKLDYVVAPFSAGAQVGWIHAAGES